ncbi:hypothetical protein E1A91_D12G062600v1 [Gossypium mustelinum]|uniref:Uncharacterized protein n=1 Tax=Gossypium mustelinum TaxID=34275 RepID=A0A5D2SC98_GOSMU|nr:hypothetical protein E1A91_D12G062600v1 [Gossypium mustelinum]
MITCIVLLIVVLLTMFRDLKALHLEVLERIFSIQDFELGNVCGRWFFLKG